MLFTCSIHVCWCSTFLADVFAIYLHLDFFLQKLRPAVRRSSGGLFLPGRCQEHPRSRRLAKVCSGFHFPRLRQSTKDETWWSFMCDLSQIPRPQLAISAKKTCRGLRNACQWSAALSFFWHVSRMHVWIKRQSKQILLSKGQSRNAIVLLLLNVSLVFVCRQCRGLHSSSPERSIATQKESQHRPNMLTRIPTSRYSALSSRFGNGGSWVPLHTVYFTTYIY